MVIYDIALSRSFVLFRCRASHDSVSSLGVVCVVEEFVRCCVGWSLRVLFGALG